ncbi:MAG: hypothetical protein QOJ81_116 [Chloroflexota bacterium]|jgi:hypothetical protein|nr:hypothetical protein [Chloroflexota bacterium]
MRGVTVLICVCLSAAFAAACAPAALTQDEILPAFISASQDETRAMHMEWQGTLGQPLAQLRPDPAIDPNLMSVTVNGSFDFNGPDYAGGLRTSSAGMGQTDTSYARVGGVAFMDFAGSGWQRSGDFGQPPIELDPLHGLQTGGVLYETADTLDGRQVHRLRVLDPVSALAGGMFANGMFGAGAPALAPDGASDFLIYVDARGIPVSAMVALDLLMDPTVTDNVNTGTSYQVRFDYQFSLWGEPVTISPPAVTGGGFDDFPPPPGVKPV